MIDCGNVETAAGGEPSSGEVVRLGRYLTLVTGYGLKMKLRCSSM